MALRNYLVRCTLKAANGKPEDDCINTFCVSNDNDLTFYGDLCQPFTDFYTQVAGTFGQAVGEFINNSIQRVNGLVVDLIEDPQTPPNIPVFTQVSDLPEPDEGKLPQEASVCVSFYTGDYLTMPNPGRHRGRVYIGPLTSTAGEDPGEFDVLRPHPNFVLHLTQSVTKLLQSFGSDELAAASWTLWSRAAGNTFNAVQAGWVDNEFDTQRRRGRTSTARTVWPVTID